jgi:hypothetical protein
MVKKRIVRLNPKKCDNFTIVRINLSISPLAITNISKERLYKYGQSYDIVPNASIKDIESEDIIVSSENNVLTTVKMGNIEGRFLLTKKLAQNKKIECDDYLTINLKTLLKLLNRKEHFIME